MSALSEDFKGWREFVNKYEAEPKDEEKIKLCEERVQTWLDVL